MLDRALVPVRVGRLGDVVDQVEQGGGLVIEGRAEGQLVGFVGVQAAAQVVELAGGGQRGRGQDHAGFLMPEVLLHQRADVQRGDLQRQSAAVGLDLHPVDQVRLAARQTRPSRLASTSHRRR